LPFFLSQGGAKWPGITESGGSLSYLRYYNRCEFEHLEGAPDLELTKASRWNDVGACVES
jgi:hypothetical protein